MASLFISHTLPSSSRLRPHVHFFTNCSRNTTPPPPRDRKVKMSFAEATGELLLGIASSFIRTSSDYDVSVAKIPVLRLPRKRINMEDEIEPEVIWEQRVKDIEAEKQRRVVSTSTGFSFSAAGLLLPYHLGAAQFLIEKGYIKETTPLAGSSAGAIACVVIASGGSMDEALGVTKTLADDCRLNGTAFRLGAVLRDMLDKFLPDDIHTRSNGRVRVAVTQLLWRPRGLLVDQFNCKEDVINAVITSSFIPGYLAPIPATMYRNRLCVDGGLTLYMPPTSASKTVRVCAFPTGQLGNGIGISPDCNPENRATTRVLDNWALKPADDAVLDKLFELGYLDAAVWGEQNPAENGSAKSGMRRSRPNLTAMRQVMALAVNASSTKATEEANAADMWPDESFMSPPQAHRPWETPKNDCKLILIIDLQEFGMRKELKR